ncbi:MAG: PocR ligand-binding domain-containing protein [Deltaproteobacteria bacterium]|nr:PocR ligand-binding domain-containing protein [Deltaproteobacteria bacterium]
MDDPRRYLGLHTVSMLRELIRKWWQVDIGFADSSGRLLDEAWGQVPVSGNDFCRALLTADQGRKVCLKCVREINGRLRGVRASPKPVSHICHLGLGMVACPVHVRKRYSGFVFACGYSNRELSRTRIGRLRGSLADILDKKVSLAGERVPVLGREDVERMKDLLEYGAREMALFDRELARLETVPGEDTEISFKGY